jgi:hypothetical protein
MIKYNLKNQRQHKKKSEVCIISISKYLPPTNLTVTNTILKQRWYAL